MSHVPCVLMCSRKSSKAPLPFSGLFSSILEIILQLLQLREEIHVFFTSKINVFLPLKALFILHSVGRIDLSLFIVLSCLFLHISKKNSMSHSRDSRVQISTPEPGFAPQPSSSIIQRLGSSLVSSVLTVSYSIYSPHTQTHQTGPGVNRQTPLQSLESSPDSLNSRNAFLVTLSFGSFHELWVHVSVY